MIGLDANAFYWYYGRDKLNMSDSVPKLDVVNLKKFLNNCEDKCITASALIEIFVHFRDTPDFLSNMIDFIYKNHLRVHNNLPQYVFSDNELTFIKMASLKDLNIYAYKLLDEKIKIESNFAFVFLEILTLLYANYHFKTNQKLDKNVQDNLMLLMGKELNYMEDYLDQLSESLYSGYADRNKSEQYLKKKYMELLTQNCVIIHMITDAVEGVLDNKDDLLSIMCTTAQNVKTGLFTNSNTMKTIRDNLANDSTFITYAKDEIVDIFINKGFSYYQSKYIKYMLSAWIDNAQQLRKNDIFDMLCMGIMDKTEFNETKLLCIDQSTYLLTFDDKMRSFIAKERCNNSVFINRFMLPEFII